jgi:hypothetical protein
VVERGDAGARGGQQRLVAVAVFVVGIAPVGQEGQHEVVAGAGEEVHFEAFDLVGDRVEVGQHRRHRHQRAQRGRHAVAQLEAGQRHRAELAAEAAVHDGHGEVRGWHHGEQAEPEARPGPDAERQQGGDRHGREAAGQRRDHRQVTLDAGGDAQARQPFLEGHAAAELSFERAAPCAEQVLPGVGVAAAQHLVDRQRVVGCCAAARHHRGDDVFFAAAAAARERFDGMAVAVARREVHRPEVADRRERRVDGADALEEVVPVDDCHAAHAGDAVLHGQVGRPLPQQLVGDDALLAAALRRQPFVEPGQRRRDLRIVVAQAHHHLRRERAPQGATRRPGDCRRWTAVAAGHRVAGDRMARHRAAGHRGAQHRGDEIVGGRALGAVADHSLRGAAYVLDEHEPQHDRHRPQLADGQRLHLLVGAHEGDEQFRIEVAVAVGHVGAGQPEHPR